MPVDLQKALSISHQIMKMHLCEGATVVDATAGKGRDTLFLSRIVGPEGRVYSFDIQSQAIECSKMLLGSSEHPDNVILIHDSHENIGRYVKEPIDGAMFNLGYLPGGDHSITTVLGSTLKAVKCCMELLKPGGIITICVYWGHPQGREEKDGLLEFCKKIDPENFTALKLEFINQINQPPLLLVLQKKLKKIL